MVDVDGGTVGDPSRVLFDHSARVEPSLHGAEAVHDLLDVEGEGVYVDLPVGGSHFDQGGCHEAVVVRDETVAARRHNTKTNGQRTNKNG